MGYSYGQGYGHTFKGIKGTLTPTGPVPVNTVAPVISGTPTVGQTLSCPTGTWTNSPTSYTYHWHDGSVYLQEGASNTYVLAAGDYNKTIGCAVVAINAAGSSGQVASSNMLGPVAGLAPVNTVLPVITGTPTVGQTLSVSDGTWIATPSVSAYGYQWKNAGVAIGGALSQTYILQTSDEGDLITCTVTAINAVSSTAATSAAVGPIASGEVSAPVLSAVSAVDFADIFVWGQATTDTASGTLYGVVVPQADATPSATQIIEGKNAAGTVVTQKGNVAISASGVKQVLMRSLTANTAYKLCLAHQAASGNSNVVTANFTSDIFIAQFAHNGSVAGWFPTGAVLTGNQSDPYGGTTACRISDNNDGLTNQAVSAGNGLTYNNGVTKFHWSVKWISGAVWERANPGANITAGPSVFNWNITTGVIGNTTGYTGTMPVTFDIGSGWRMCSSSKNTAGADVSGSYSHLFSSLDGAASVAVRNGTHIRDFHDIRFTRPAA